MAFKNNDVNVLKKNKKKKQFTNIQEQDVCLLAFLELWDTSAEIGADV